MKREAISMILETILPLSNPLPTSMPVEQEEEIEKENYSYSSFSRRERTFYFLSSVDLGECTILAVCDQTAKHGLVESLR